MPLDLPIKSVVRTSSGDTNPAPWQDAYGEHGELINSGEFNGLDFQGAFDAIEVALIKKNLGASRTQFRLRDWGISRQWRTGAVRHHVFRQHDWQLVFRYRHVTAGFAVDDRDRAAPSSAGG